MTCPKCGSSSIVSRSASEVGMGIGAQVGGVLACALLVTSGLALAGLLGGAFAGGAVGAHIAGKRLKHVCQGCWCSWVD